MAPEASRLTRQITLALVALASIATEVAAADDRAFVQSLGWGLLWAGMAAGLAWLVPLPGDNRRIPPRWQLLVLVVLAALPYILDPFERAWTSEGHPLEMQMVFSLRNLGLGLAALGAWILCLRLACVVSLFLMLFAITMTDHAAVMVLLGLYTATGSVWLMHVYWTGLRRFFVLADTSVAVQVQPGKERLPWFAAFATVGLVGCVVSLFAVGPQRAATVLAEWLPTSGGTGGFDPFANCGINDGDDQIKGPNAHSTGMTESDLFLDSPLPTLYDMLTDMYGEPFKPRDKERAVALDAQTKVLESRKLPADNLRPNREFATTRTGPRKPRDPANRAARALFEVEGRTPLHVRVTAYDAFDGRSWLEAPMRSNTCLLEKEPDSCWMKIEEMHPLSIFAAPESHKFKIARQYGSLVPTPPHLTRFKMGRVNEASFFAWGQDRILKMAERTTPPGVVVETECRTVDPRLLPGIEFGRPRKSERFQYTALPEKLNPEVEALAHRWADSEPGGWEQIAAVMQHLRSEYTVEPSARVPDDCRDPVGHFLLEMRRGPDYQFASAAVVLLRVLGYPTRLVTGFYVAPDAYDPVTRHTPVVKEDLHFWAEVMLPSNDWLVVEPTPGYEVLAPSTPLSERIAALLCALALGVWHHAVELSLGLLLLSVLWWRRQALLDAAAFALWRWYPGRTWQQCVRRTCRLLEWRGRRAGRPRPGSQTLSLWLQATLPDPAADRASIPRLTQMFDWATYAADLAPPWNQEEVAQICRRVLGQWTVRELAR